MRRFMVGDKVRVKNWQGDRRPDFLLTGTVIAAYSGGWYTIKHDDISYETYKKSRRYESWIGPRFDWREEDLTHVCGLLRLLDSLDDGRGRLSA